MEFGGCDELSGISLPDTVTSIGNNAFYDCDTLTSISFSDTSTWYKTTNADNWANKTGAGFSSTSQKKFFFSNFCHFLQIGAVIYMWIFFPDINNFKEDISYVTQKQKIQGFSFYRFVWKR